MSLFLLLLGKLFDIENVTSENAIRDNNDYPQLLDPWRTARGIQTFNSKVLPFFQARTFHLVQLPYAFSPEYGREFRLRKRMLEIETATTDLLDNHIFYPNHTMVGDYGIQIPNLIEKIDLGNQSKKKQLKKTTNSIK